MSLVVGAQTDRIEKQLTKIEERLDQAVLDRRRIEDTINTRIDTLEEHMEARFDGIDARFDRLEKLLTK